MIDMIFQIHYQHVPLSSSNPRRRINVNLQAATTPNASCIVIRPAQSEVELLQVAQQRAEAYYENESYGRFTRSFIKQFAQKEALSLTKRTAGGKDAECITLVILPSSSSPSPSPSPDQQQQQEPQQLQQPHGSLDIRPPASYNNIPPQGVPPHHTQHSGYVLNVVVQSEQRRRGLGRQLVEEAKRLGRQEWNAKKLYAHVDATNDAAIGCYQACGFEIVPQDDDDDGSNSNSDSSRDVPRLKIGRRLLLCCHL